MDSEAFTMCTVKDDIYNAYTLSSCALCSERLEERYLRHMRLLEYLVATTGIPFI